MKKLLLILTVITLTFQSCSSSDDSNDIDDEPIIAVCNTPISLSISQITEYSAVLNWDNLNNNLDVKVEYGLTGFSPGNGSVISVSQNSININNIGRVVLEIKKYLMTQEKESIKSQLDLMQSVEFNEKINKEYNEILNKILDINRQIKEYK